MDSSTKRRYSGRLFSAQEIEQIRALIDTRPQMSRQQLSYRVCEAFDWRKSDGSLKDMSCRLNGINPLDYLRALMESCNMISPLFLFRRQRSKCSATSCSVNVDSMRAFMMPPGCWFSPSPS